MYSFNFNICTLCEIKAPCQSSAVKCLPCRFAMGAGLSVNEKDIQHEVTNVVSKTTDNVLNKSESKCIQEVTQDVDTHLGKDAKIGACRSVTLRAKVDGQLQCMQTVTNQNELINELSTEIAKAVTNKEKTPMLHAALNQTKIQLSETDVRKNVHKTLATKIDQECRQTIKQTVRTKLDEGAKITVGCSDLQMSTLGGLCEQEMQNIADAVAAGKTAEEINSLYPTDQRICDELDDCCDPAVQSLTVGAEATVDSGCVQVSDIVTSIRTLIEDTADITQTKEKESASLFDIPSETLYIIAGIVGGVVLLIIIVTVVFLVSKSQSSSTTTSTPQSSSTMTPSLQRDSGSRGSGSPVYL